MKNIFRNIGIVIVIVIYPVLLTAQSHQGQVSVIFDSDMGPDFDDVGALAMLHALADSGEAKILATIASNRQPEKTKIFGVINTYFEHPEMPIGIPRGIAVEREDFRGWGQVLVNKFPHDIKSNGEIYGAVELYRKILSNQPDKSVTIVTVGFLTNVAKLLVTGPDEYSKLNGQELVSKKVDKLVSMAGTYPNGKEHNINMDSPAADYVFEHWPTEIIFSGFKIGEKIRTGIPLVNNKGIKKSPVKEAYMVGLPQNPEDEKNGRMSWDQTAVLVAVRGPTSYYHLVPGRNTVDSDGANNWDYSGSGHYYLVEKKPADHIQKLINKLMQHEPHK